MGTAAAAVLDAADLQQRQLLFGWLPQTCASDLHLPLLLHLLLTLLQLLTPAAGRVALAPAPAAHSNSSNTVICGSHSIN
jgi:hypothetical protein